MISKNIAYPFSAIVGQEDIKKALIWNVINPKIGGVLICGEKGTAKSTIVRGLCSVVSEIDVVDLPLNVTEDRLIGSNNFEHAIKYGEKKFEDGILKRADGNILYVDEINLLSDHIVKSLVETASSGINLVEREGISYSHKSKFILVGSMNPEEGGLRPQFLDRFGLYVDVKAEDDIKKRVEIIRRRLEYEDSAKSFIAKYKKQNEELHNKIMKGKEAIKDIVVTENAMQIAASISREAGCAGHRAELIIIETAKAIAALEVRKSLNIDDIKEAAKFVLPHRTRDKQQEQEKNNNSESRDNDENDDNQDNQNDNTNNENQDNEDNKNQPPDSNDETRDDLQEDNEQSEAPQSTVEVKNSEPDNNDSQDEENANQPDMQDDVDAPGQTFDVAKWLYDKSRKNIAKGSGKRCLVKTSSNQGRYVRYRSPYKGEINDIAFDATLRSAAPYQCHRKRENIAFSIKKSDIKVKVREKRTGNTILFVVDASGSMGANKRMQSVKGAILSLLNDAYQKRDKVGLIAFRRQSAEVLLGITRSVELAQKELISLPTGGRTPLEAGLNLAYDVIKSAQIKDKDLLPVIVLVSDGKATYSETNKDAFKAALASARKIATKKIKSVVIDTDESYIKLHMAEMIASAMNAQRFEVEDLQAQDLITAVKMSL